MQGAWPAARTGHTATVVGSRVYVSGGMTQGSVLRDLWTLDSQASTWREHADSGQIAPRLNHTCTRLENTLCLLGGASFEEIVSLGEATIVTL